jgi:hypothetical protein
MVGENAQLSVDGSKLKIGRKKICTHLMVGEKNGSTEMHLNVEFALNGRLKKIRRRKKICRH